MAIDPTTPVTPIIPALPAGNAPDAVAIVQALARQALANSTAQLGEIVGRPANTPPKTGAPVEQAGQASTQDAGHAADTTGAKTVPPGLQQTAQAKPETRLIRAVRTAAAEAVPRQTGLAPLMANVRAVVARPDMPIEVREAGRVLLAKAPTVAEIVTPQGLRRAVEGSGVFLEARMARAAAAPPQEGLSRLPESNDMKAALLVFRGALSAWLAKAALLIADAPSVEPSPAIASAEDDPQTPSASPRAAMPTASAPATTAPRSAAVASSMPGAIVQPDVEAARSQATAVAGPSPQTAEIPKTASEAAPSVTKAPEPAPEDDGLAARFGAFVATPKPSAPIQTPVRAAMSALVQLGLIAEEALAEEPTTTVPADVRPLAPRGYGAATAEAARSKVPPPPYAGGPMAGQKPSAPELQADLAPADLVRRLLKGTSGALARQDLMQIASLPDAHSHEAEVAEARPQSGRLNLDLPFMTPQGMAVAQFEISHDGGGSGGGAVGPAERTYKARFSIDIEPLGPVHALVSLTGSRARVSLWAERAETIARLRAGEESLGAALRDAELSPEVAVHSGAPVCPGGASPLGHFVDQAS